MWVCVPLHAVDLVEPVGDDVGEVLVPADPHHRDQVDVTGDGVDLADPVDLGDRLGDLGDAGDFGVDEHDGGDHGVTLARVSAPRVPNAVASRRRGRCRRRSGTAGSSKPTASRGAAASGSRRARAAPAPCTGQVHSPSRETIRTPGASSQRRTFSVSSAVAAGSGPGAGRDDLGAGGQGVDVRHRVGAARASRRPREPAEADTDDLPAAVGGAPGGHDLGGGGQRGQPLGTRGGADEVQHPVTHGTGVLEPLLRRPAGSSASCRAETTSRESPRARRPPRRPRRRSRRRSATRCTARRSDPSAASAQSADRPRVDSFLVHWRSGTTSCSAAIADSADSREENGPT